MELSKEQVLEKRIEQVMELSNEIDKFIYDLDSENEQCEILDRIIDESFKTLDRFGSDLENETDAALDIQLEMYDYWYKFLSTLKQELHENRLKKEES